MTPAEMLTIGPVVQPLVNSNSNARSTRSEKAAPNKELIVDELKVSAYPNPFVDRVNFVITSSNSGQSILEVFNSLGQQLDVVYRGHLLEGRDQVVEYKVPAIGSNNLIYKLTVVASKFQVNCLKSNKIRLILKSRFGVTFYFGSG